MSREKFFDICVPRAAEISKILDRCEATERSQKPGGGAMDELLRPLKERLGVKPEPDLVLPPEPSAPLGSPAADREPEENRWLMDGYVDKLDSARWRALLAAVNRRLIREANMK